MDLDIEENRWDKFKKKKYIALIVTGILAMVAMYFFLQLIGPSPLNTYFKEGAKIKSNDQAHLIVEYRNLQGKDLDNLDVEVQAVHKSGNKIKFPTGNTAHEEQIGKGQVRRFSFPVTFTGLREGSTYALEVKVKAGEDEITKRVSVRVEGGN